MSNACKLTLFFLVVVGVLSCTCATPLKVSPIQKTDKKLSCKDVILEINESEHYRALAKREEGIRFGNMLMPVCWVSSYYDASQAVRAADERIKYLGHIYDVLDCGGKSDKTAAGAAVVAPPLIQIQPVPSAEVPARQPAQSEQKPPSQCPTAEDQAKYTHQHTDRLGKVYTHCHYNTGKHRHIDD